MRTGFIGGFRFRLVMALPLIAACFSLAAGLYPLLMVERSLDASTPELRALMPTLKIAVIFVAATAAIIGAAVAAYISKPIQQIAREMNELAEQRQVGAKPPGGENEIEALMRIFRTTVAPLKGQLASVDLVMQMSEGIMGLDRDGNIVVLNTPLEQLFQVDRKDFVGTNYRSLFPEGARNAEIEAMIREVLDGEPVATRDIVVTARDGREVYLRASASPASGRKNERIGAVLLFKNFGEFGRLKDDLRRIDALAALGSSVTGMAHEVRTPIGYIRSLAELLEEDLPPGSKHHQYVSTIIDSTDRLNTVVGNILSLAKVRVDASRSEDVVTLLREATAYSRSALEPKKLTLREDYPLQGYSIKADRDRLIECFINLFNNACEASDAEGVVTIRVRPIAVGNLSSQVAHTVMVEFHNNGSTIAVEDMEKLFVPFYTTKKQGTGLGLPICKQIIEAHGGALRVESDSQKGTLFRVLLPE